MPRVGRKVGGRARRAGRGCRRGGVQEERQAGSGWRGQAGRRKRRRVDPDLTAAAARKKGRGLQARCSVRRRVRRLRGSVQRELGGPALGAGRQGAGLREKRLGPVGRGASEVAAGKRPTEADGRRGQERPARRG